MLTQPTLLLEITADCYFELPTKYVSVIYFLEKELSVNYSIQHSHSFF